MMVFTEGDYRTGREGVRILARRLGDAEKIMEILRASWLVWRGRIGYHTSSLRMSEIAPMVNGAAG